VTVRFVSAEERSSMRPVPISTPLFDKGANATVNSEPSAVAEILNRPHGLLSIGISQDPITEFFCKVTNWGIRKSNSPPSLPEPICLCSNTFDKVRPQAPVPSHFPYPARRKRRGPLAQLSPSLRDCDVMLIFRSSYVVAL